MSPRSNTSSGLVITLLALMGCGRVGTVVDTGAGAPAAPTRWVQVVAGNSSTCALDDLGHPRCWGALTALGWGPYPERTYAELGLSHETDVGLAMDPKGDLDAFGDVGRLPDAPARGGYTDIGVSDDLACALDGDGTPVCWGNDVTTMPPPGKYTQISTSSVMRCALSDAGEVACWNDSDSPYAWRILTPPPGPWAQVSVGEGASCARSAEGLVACWPDWAGQPSTAGFVDLSVGYEHACGAHADGTVECWDVTAGASCTVGQCDPPADDFVAVSAGSGHSCGLTRDGRIRCWGYDGSGQLDVPELPSDAGDTGSN